MTAAQILTRFAEIIDARDWDRLPEVLADGFLARFVHTGETFDRDGFVALNRDYPIVVRFLVEDLVADGDRAVLRARVTDGADTWHVASFATIGADGLLSELVEVWAEVSARTRTDVRPAQNRRSVGTMTNLHHTIDYVELNVGAAMAETRAFYEQAFGWAFNDYGPGYAGIRWSSGDGEVGGLNAARDAVRGGPLVLLYSDDLDATADAVRSAGGEVVEGPYEFPGGRRFHFTDPAGNELGVWASR